MVSRMEAPGPLREVRSWEEALPDRSADADVLEAMLLTAGEKGYAKATVREVAERARITQDRFHRRFGGKEACFARAYEEAAERLAAELLEALRPPPRRRAARPVPRRRGLARGFRRGPGGAAAFRRRAAAAGEGAAARGEGGAR